MASTSILAKNEIQSIDSFFFRHPFREGESAPAQSKFYIAILSGNHYIWRSLFSNLSSYSQQLIFHEGIPQLEDFDSNKRMLLILVLFM